MRRAALLLLLLSWPTPAVAADIFGGYSALRLDGATVHGGGGAVRWPLTESLKIVVEGSYHRGLVRGENLDEWAFLAGLALTPWQVKRVGLFVHAKGGLVRSRRQVEVFDVAIGPDGVCDGGCPYSFGPAGEFGGGLDLRLTDRLAARLAQLDYRLARLDGETIDSLRLSAGVVYRWGR